MGRYGFVLSFFTSDDISGVGTGKSKTGICRYAKLFFNSRQEENSMRNAKNKNKLVIAMILASMLVQPLAGMSVYADEPATTA